MSAPDPLEPVAPGTGKASESAQLARERLHREIERVRKGVEEMLDEQERTGREPGVSSEAVRLELIESGLATRDYVKKKVRKSEKKLGRTVRELEKRSDRLEDRIDEVEAERERAEWRIHTNTEMMLDGLLEDVRAIADRLAARPQPGPATAP
jgi:chromosome segregation ATPase